MRKIKKISVISSFYNEEDSIQIFYESLKKIFNNLNIEYEFIFINDDSNDKSNKILLTLCENDLNVKLINMSRRFGHQECIVAGLNEITGDAAIIMDIDLQDPPELIPQMIEKYNQGYDVINTKRKVRHGEGYIKLKLTKFAYKIINIFSEIDLPEDSGIFKLIDKKIILHALKTNEKDPYIRGLFNWVGFNQYIIEYERVERAQGQSKYGIFSSLNPWKEVVRGITSFSLVPLYLPLFIGFVISTISFFGIIYVLLQKFYLDNVTSGWTSLILSILLIGGLILVILGIIGIYLGKIYQIVRNRPNYIIKEKINFKKDN